MAVRVTVRVSRGALSDLFWKDAESHRGENGDTRRNARCRFIEDCARALRRVHFFLRALRALRGEILCEIDPAE
jgi:hypothetical protein